VAVSLAFKLDFQLHDFEVVLQLPLHRWMWHFAMKKSPVLSPESLAGVVGYPQSSCNQTDAFFQVSFFRDEWAANADLGVFSFIQCMACVLGTQAWFNQHGALQIFF
jgi:hypothetical protein